MGLFGGKGEKSKADASQAGTATYVSMENGDPIQATVVPDEEEGDTKKKPTIANLPTTATAKQDSGLVFITRHPTFVPQCPFCHTVNARTRTRTAPGVLTFAVAAGILVLIAGLLHSFVIGLIFCTIPFCIDAGKSTTHFCLNCNNELGTIGPLTDCCSKNR